ncbi:uncharacterized protein proca1 [Paramormyrops kingsleyae]|uniref:phospholipase A2 n=1 Tax=Paramormyrops kingsleyae TaxID=1676925 RepID=A0A3B3RW98_9TELE|nr:uncharacterized protein LOC111847152 [Paramormyrops kingsleyae]
MWSMIFVFLSYLDRNFVKAQILNDLLDAETESSEVFYMINGTFCGRSTRLAGNYLHQVSDGAEEVRTLRNLAGDLADCSVTRSQMEVKSFMHVCRLGLKDQRHKLVDSHKSLLNVAEAKSHCQAFLRKPKRGRGTGSSSTGPGEEDKSNVGVETGGAQRRIKRGFTYPGTLWCGAGNIAENYDQLGEFTATDSCCRVHDHCPYVVQAFSTNFGYTNFKWHSISHCECDNALKECLRKVNDTSSRVVGQAFFNVIEVPCFEFVLEDQCVERHWYGLCKRYDKVPIAVLRESIPYDFGGVDVIDTLTLATRVQKVPDRPEGATRPLASAGEEPSIRNVVTAAEDFIKVLATVSTSHGSTTESARKEAHRGDRKKKKMMDRKMKKKKKDKGRRRKQRVSTLSRPEEASAVTPSARRTEEADNNGLLMAAHLDRTLERNVNILTESVPDLDVHSHKLIKDEPQWRPADRSVSPAAPPTATRAEPETDMGGRTSPRSSPPAEQPVPESDTDAGRLRSDSSTHTSQPQKTPRHKPRHNMGPKKKKEDMSSFSLSVERPVFSIPLTAALRTGLNSKAKHSSASAALHAVSTETSGRLQPRNSEDHGERAVLHTSTGQLSTRPLRTEKQKCRASREQRPKRRISPMSPSVLAPAMGKLQATPQPQLQQPWLTWVHKMLGSLGNVA